MPFSNTAGHPDDRDFMVLPGSSIEDRHLPFQVMIEKAFQKVILLGAFRRREDVWGARLPDHWLWQVRGRHSKCDFSLQVNVVTLRIVGAGQIQGPDNERRRGIILIGKSEGEKVVCLAPIQWTSDSCFWIQVITNR